MFSVAVSAWITFALRPQNAMYFFILFIKPDIEQPALHHSSVLQGTYACFVYFIHT